jgi:hypothetical protein
MARNLGSDRTKLVVAVVFLIAAAGIAYYNLRGSSVLPNSVKFVCVATGKFFDIASDKIETVPLKNPKTGEATLMPCSQHDGTWRVSPRYRKELQALGEKNRYVDTKTLAVQTAP